MAISNKIFDAPVGETYDPSSQIRENLSGLGKSVSGVITNESNRLQKEQSNFAEMYANLGEIDAELQESYAGINQEMLTSATDWLKEQYKAGVNSNDPEFIQGFSKRISSLKAGMGNADRKREGVTNAAEYIKNDNSISDKTGALSYVYNLSNNPDYLISKNDISLFNEVKDKFRVPKLVSDDFLSTIPSDGTEESTFIGRNGDLMKRTITYNRFIPRDNPLLPDGSPNVQVSLGDAKELMEGKFGQGILDLASKTRKDRYPNLPVDVGYQKSMTDLIKLSAGNNVQTTVLKSKNQLDREEKSQNQNQQRINIAAESVRSREKRLSNSGVDPQEEEKRFEKFKADYDSGKGIILADYVKVGGDIKEMEWSKNPNKEALSSFENWKKLSTEDKNNIIETYNVSEGGIPKTDSYLFGLIGNNKDLNSKKTYDLVKSITDTYDIPEINGITFKVKNGSGSNLEWPTEKIKIESEDDLKAAFKQLENTRVSGQSTTPIAEVPEGETVSNKQPIKASDRVNKLP